MTQGNKSPSFRLISPRDILVRTLSSHTNFYIQDRTFFLNHLYAARSHNLSNRTEFLLNHRISIYTT